MTLIENSEAEERCFKGEYLFLKKYIRNQVVDLERMDRKLTRLDCVVHMLLLIV